MLLTDEFRLASWSQYSFTENYLSLVYGCANSTKRLSRSPTAFLLPVDPLLPFGVSYGSLKPAMLYTRGTRSAQSYGNLQYRVLSVWEGHFWDKIITRFPVVGKGTARHVDITKSWVSGVNLSSGCCNAACRERTFLDLCSLQSRGFLIM